jgi:hypothetical protein
MSGLLLATEQDAKTECPWETVIAGIRHFALTQTADVAADQIEWADLLEAISDVRD